MTEPLTLAQRHPLEAYADSYAQMNRTGYVTVDCRSVEADIRQNMIPATVAAAEITRLTAANKALTAERDDLQYKAEKYDSVVKALSVCDGGRYRTDTIESCILALKARATAEAKLAKVEAELADERLHFSNYMAVVEPKIDRLSAELAEAQKREEHAIKAIEEALGWHQTTHIHMALRAFLASKESPQPEAKEARE